METVFLSKFVTDLGSGWHFSRCKRESRCLLSACLSSVFAPEIFHYSKMAVALSSKRGESTVVCGGRGGPAQKNNLRLEAPENHSTGFVVLPINLQASLWRVA